MNIDKLLEVRALILKHPEHFNMSAWFQHDRECGTTACIAGWAIASHYQQKEEPTLEVDDVLQAPRIWRMFEVFPDSMSPTECARSVLDLDGDEADRLFYVTSWPAEYRRRYIEARNLDKAGVTVARIDHFIATEGKE